MLKNVIKRLFPISCIVALLMTAPGMTVLADEMQQKEVILSDSSESEWSELASGAVSYLRSESLDVSGFDISNIPSKDRMLYIFYGCSNLLVLKTLKKNSCERPLRMTMYDKSGKEYTTLPLTTSGSIILTRERPDGKTDLSECTVTLRPTSYTYNGIAKKPVVTVKDGDTVLTSGTDYTVRYENNKNAGTATVRVTGTGNCKGEKTVTFTIKAASLEKASVSGVSLTYGFSGKAYTPAPTVKIDGVTLTKDKDYTVLYENNTDPGTATVTITGTGNYSGTITKTFEIVECASSIVSGKTYQLVPKNNYQTAVCPKSGGMVNDTQVYITDRSSSEAMKFRAVKNPDGSWKFINAKCELALAVQQNSDATGAGLVLYDQTADTAQNWRLSRKSDNSYAIKNAVTGYSIATSKFPAVKGTTFSMAETAASTLQRFYFVETTAVDAPYSGTYSVRASKDKSFGLNISSSSKEDGASVNLYTYTNTDAKKFKIIYSGGGYYRLVNVNSGLCLTIKDNSDADGANIIQSKWKGYSSQRWKITKNSDGTVTITNMLGTVLHLLGNRTVDNTNVHARKAASTTAQKWFLQ